MLIFCLGVSFTTVWQENQKVKYQRYCLIDIWSSFGSADLLLKKDNFLHSNEGKILTFCMVYIVWKHSIGSFRSTFDEQLVFAVKYCCYTKAWFYLINTVFLNQLIVFG